MSADVKIFGRVRQLLQGIDQASVGDDEQIALNEQLEQLVAIATSPYGEIVKIGRAFEVHTGAAVAAVVALPTTACALSVWNGEPDGGRAYVIDRCWAIQIASAAAAGQACLIGCLGQTRVASIAQGGTTNPLNGLNAHDTKSITSISSLDAVTGVSANWSLLPGQTGGVRVGVTSIPGMFVNANVDGRRIIPPGRLFGINLIADTVATTFICGIEWHERQIRLG